MLNLPCFARGVRKVPLLEAQRLGGTTQSWLVVFPALAHELRILHRLLSTQDGLFCQPKGTPGEVDRLWLEIWDALDFLKMVLTDPTAWSTNFGRPLTHILPFDEQISIPGGLMKVRIIGADATPEFMGATS